MTSKALNTDLVRKFYKTAGGFYKLLDKVEIIKAENGNYLAELKVREEHTNPMGALHGGLSATLVDVLTTSALDTLEESVGKTSVSVDLHMMYLKAALLGDDILIDSQTLKAGRSVAYLKCEIRNKATGELLVKGTHTKYLMQRKKK